MTAIAELTADELKAAKVAAKGDQAAWDAREKLVPIAERISPRSLESIRTADIPPRTWFHEGFITAGLSLVVAKKGMGKTFFLFQLAAAIALGGGFLGRRTTRARVLLILLELDEIGIHERALRQGPQPENLDCVTTWPTGDAALIAIEAAIVVLEYKVIIVDMLPGILPDGHDTNSYDEQPFYAKIRSLGLKYRVAVVGSWHSGKSPREDHVDAAIGSTGKVAQCDSIITLDRRRGETGGKIFVSGNHGADTTINVGFEDCTWDLSSGPTAPVLSETDQIYMNVLNKHPEGLSTSVLAITKGGEANATRAAMSRLQARGFVSKKDSLWFSVEAHGSHEGAPCAQRAGILEPGKAHERARAPLGAVRSCAPEAVPSNTKAVIGPGWPASVQVEMDDELELF